MGFEMYYIKTIIKLFSYNYLIKKRWLVTNKNYMITFETKLKKRRKIFKEKGHLKPWLSIYLIIL